MTRTVESSFWLGRLLPWVGWGSRMSQWCTAAAGVWPQPNEKLQECHRNIVYLYDWHLSTGTAEFVAVDGGNFLHSLLFSISLGSSCSWLWSCCCIPLKSSRLFPSLQRCPWLKAFSLDRLLHKLGLRYVVDWEKSHLFKPILQTLHVISCSSPILSDLPFSTTTSIPSKPYLLAPSFIPQTQIMSSIPINLLQMSLHPTFWRSRLHVRGKCFLPTRELLWVCKPF